MVDEALKKRCLDMIVGNYVEEVRALARATLAMMERDGDYQQMSTNLREVQTRCTDLIEENRVLRSKLSVGAAIK